MPETRAREKRHRYTRCGGIIGMMSRRESLDLAVVAIAAAAPVIAAIAWWSRLPSPMAVHWGMSGHPNGSGPRWVLPIVSLGLGAFVVVSRRLGGRDERAAVFLSGVATFVAVGAIGALRANVDVG